MKKRNIIIIMILTLTTVIGGILGYTKYNKINESAITNSSDIPMCLYGCPSVRKKRRYLKLY